MRIMVYKKRRVFEDENEVKRPTFSCSTPNYHLQAFLLFSFFFFLFPLFFFFFFFPFDFALFIIHVGRYCHIGLNDFAMLRYVRYSWPFPTFVTSWLLSIPYQRNTNEVYVQADVNHQTQCYSVIRIHSCAWYVSFWIHPAFVKKKSRYSHSVLIDRDRSQSHTKYMFPYSFPRFHL